MVHPRSHNPYEGLDLELMKLATANFEDLSSREKAAKWLIENVGVGQFFSTNDMRAALPGIAQLDRRVRELRESDWIISLPRDDATIPYGFRRLDHIGNLRTTKGGISDRIRRSIFDADDHRCVICGISAGEEYNDGLIATLQIGHIVPQAQGGTDDVSNLRTECHRCNEGIRDRRRITITREAVATAVALLPQREKQVLLGWLRANKRTMNPTEQAYIDVRQLSAVDRAEIIEQLEKALGHRQP